MRKESLKKNGNKNGLVDVDDGDADENNDVNGAVDSNQDPLQGVDEPILEAPKKKGRKKNDTVTEVAVPIANNEEEDYEVEDIVDHKFEKKVRFFLVRWKNCGPDEDTWEPESSLSCAEIVKKYIDNNPDAESQSSGGSRKRPTNKKERSVVPAKKAKGKNASQDDTTDVAEGEAEEEYEVEDIVDHKTVKGKTQFLIRWKNYDSSGDTWEPELSLSCPEIIKRYKDEKMKDLPETQFGKKEPKQKKENAEKDYEVQSIIDEKMQGGVKHYLVRWKGYSLENDSWEPEHSLACSELISKFQEFKKNKRESAKRGTPKKPTYTEIDETEGEDASIFANGSSKKGAKKAKGKAAQGKKTAKGKATKGQKPPQKKKAKEEEKEVEEEDYEVEDIVDEKTEKGKKYYFLKWKGYTASSNTWELADSLSCPDVLKRYLAKQKIATPKSTKSKVTKKSKASPKKAKVSKPSKKAAKSSKKSAVEDEQDWEVEKIVDVRYNEDGTKDFLIRWKGCDQSQDTWEPEANVDSPDLVNEFMSKADNSDEVEVAKKKSRKA